MIRRREAVQEAEGGDRVTESDCLGTWMRERNQEQDLPKLVSDLFPHFAPGKIHMRINPRRPEHLNLDTSS